MPWLESYQEALQTLDQQQLRRRLQTYLPYGQSNPAQPMETRDLTGQRLISFNSNDYLGYSLSPALRQAAAAAAHQWGVGCGSSRLLGATHTLVLELETTLARWKQTEAALVFPSGYQANGTLIQALCGPGDLILADRLVHASLIDGMQASGARWHRYRHLDLDHLANLLAKERPKARQCWIVTESVFSMDGDYPDLRTLGELAATHQANVLLDEAHGVGVFGGNGAGLAHHQQATGGITLQMGTFSKALGSQGAYVAGPQVLIDYLVNKARGFIYTTGLSYPVLAANLAAVTQLQSETASRDTLWQRLHSLEAGLKTLPAWWERVYGQQVRSPIVPLVLGDEATVLQASQRLREAGVLVPAIRPPTVAPGQARLRISLTALHSQANLDHLLNALATLPLNALL